MKRLTERIAERIENQKPSKKALNKAAVIALKAEIIESLNDGWSRAQIWATLHDEGKIKVTYQAFCNQVKRYIAQIDKSDFKKEITEKVNHRKAPVNQAKSFEFSSTPNKEDLL